MAQTSKDTRSIDQIRADISAARSRMAASVEGLVEQVHPTAVKQRTVNDAKSFAQDEFTNLKSQVKDDDGWRTDRLVIVGGALLGVATFLLTVRAIVGRIKKSRA
ncbi:DUF3618 domain-containing protein [Aestuariimicrobium ganziense]|uniref:DUF3618 domain-containing protein n=1 Tax=Aestuariimicrobium ganziense TaxID=2773677 RepID=UPI001942ABE3|nr:DUF3618 domain-containing protein [Aestuariimicrobium ganziense]